MCSCRHGNEARLDDHKNPEVAVTSARQIVCGVGATTYGCPHGRMTRCQLPAARMESSHATMGMCGMLPDQTHWLVVQSAWHREFIWG